MIRSVILYESHINNIIIRNVLGKVGRKVGQCMCESFTLLNLRDELVSTLSAEGIMEAYKIIAEETNMSVPVVRKWFTSPQYPSFRKPPQVKSIWEYLESLSKGRLDRSKYYPRSDFWDQND